MPLGNLVLNVCVICLWIPSYFAIPFLWNKQHKGWATGILSSLTIMLCMSFPFHLFSHYTGSLAIVILYFGILYGGRRTGLLSFIVFLIYSYWWEPTGFLHTSVTLLPVLPLVFLTRPYFLLYSTLKKFLLVSALEVFSGTIQSLNHLTYNDVLGPSIAQIWIWIILQTACLLLGLMFVETIRTSVDKYVSKQESEQAQLLRSLTSAMAHDIRNPLTVCIGFIQLLREQVENEASGRYVSTIESELENASSIITNYLSFTETEFNLDELVDVEKVVQETLALLRTYAFQYQVTIEEHIVGAVHLRGDANKLSQALFNIVKNGIESMSDGGTLRVSVYQVSNHIAIDIVDHGVGMSAEQVKRLGLPYYATADRGTGLSLMISYRFIHLMNGRIRVESALGKGTTFMILFPRSTPS